MSDTPETDAIAEIGGNWDTKALRIVDHARRLERERDKKTRMVRECELEIKDLTIRAKKVERERDEARKDLEFRRELFRVQESKLNDAMAEREEVREKYEEDRKRILQLLIERDRYKFEAEQKWAMRRELEELLGIDNGAPGDEQFQKGLKKLKELVAENKKLKCKRK